MATTDRIVDNRTFLLGLDHLYRERMKHHERGELRRCAGLVTNALRLKPARVPVEGYYAEDSHLAQYFRQVRALQQAPESDAAIVADMPEFQRLKQVMSSALYGSPVFAGRLLPAGSDPVSRALDGLGLQWTVPTVTAAASRIARASDDCSLVALAALAEDPVVLAAMRESVALYAAVGIGAAGGIRPVEYVWMVDPELERRAQRCVAAYNELFDDTLPHPGPGQAERFWRAAGEAKILGRCIRIGINDATQPVTHYHWAIRRDADGEYDVHEFWAPEIVTTAMYRAGVGPAVSRTEP